jgi:hypothetical protein
MKTYSHINNFPKISVTGEKISHELSGAFVFACFFIIIKGSPITSRE